MGLFSSLFSKKNKESEKKINHNQPKVENVVKNVQTIKSPKLHLRGKPDDNGLYPSELIMLAVAERYKTTDTNFPGYLTYNYEIANPVKMLNNLYARGFIEHGRPVETLSKYKVAELKEIATTLGVVAKGKKADIISAISAVGDDKLGEIVKERMWKLTDQGRLALDSNPYIMYFLDDPYRFSSVDVDVWTVNEEFVKVSNRPYREIIYGQLYKQMNKYLDAFQKNPAGGNSNTHKYCECYRLMGLFFEEEKDYQKAADMYFQYLYKRINVDAGVQLLVNYKLFGNEKEYKQELVNRFYRDAQLEPFHKTEVMRLIDKLDVDDESVRNVMIAAFKRADDSGIMNEKESADFIIYELSGECEMSVEMAARLAKKAMRRVH